VWSQIGGGWVRPTARVLLLDADDRVLLLRIHDPGATRGPQPITADFWLLVGGGVQRGESHVEAAYREVVEETGLRDAVIGPCLWTRERPMLAPDGQMGLMKVRFFLGRVASSAPAVNFDGHEPLEAATTMGYRWFRHDEILTREPTETFLPKGLGGLLGNVLAGTIPADPLPLP
jgi:8-oxo-dGTP pyrophosphatase MutT (NUDIX family)